MTRLTPAQRRWLLALLSGDNPWNRIHGRSAHGGAVRTVALLTSRRWLAEGQLTAAGREVAMSLVPKGETESA
jgi:hypothetical protein